MKDKILLASVTGFIGGIFLHSFVQLGTGVALLCIFLGGVLGLIGLIQHPLSISLLPPKADPSSGEKEEERQISPLVLLSVFLFVFGLGVLRFGLQGVREVDTPLQPYIGQTVTLRGVVSEEPDSRENSTQLTVSLVELGDTSEKLRVKALVTTDVHTEFRYGDLIEIKGKVERPKNFTDETTGREVAYVSYLAKDGIRFQLFKPRITLQKHGEGNVIKEKLFAIKNAFMGTIRAMLVEPHASLLGGLVVGAKHSLGQKLLDDFRTAGVIHIVVLSGYNITIIAVFIEWLLSRLRKNLRLLISAGAMILFAIMVGASATVLRATVMAILALLARGTGRIYAVTRALLVAGVIMLLHNPQILVFDVSFQLSFLATLGLIYVSPFIEPKVKWVTEWWHLREIVVATVATQLFVLPFLMYKMGVFSVVSLPVNLLILTVIPMTMLFGFLTGITAFVSSVLATPFAYLAYLFLSYELLVVEWFAKLPSASISIPYFPLWLVILWYGVYALLYFMWQRKQSTGAFKESLVS